MGEGEGKGNGKAKGKGNGKAKEKGGGGGQRVNAGRDTRLKVASGCFDVRPISLSIFCDDNCPDGGSVSPQRVFFFFLCFSEFMSMGTFSFAGVHEGVLERRRRHVGGLASGGTGCRPRTLPRKEGAYDACHDEGGTFRLNFFLNGGALKPI